MTPHRPEPGTIMDDDRLEYLAREFQAVAPILERALAPRVPAWLWFALGVFAGLALSAVWPGP
jgi:hypothetical protein